MGVILIATLIVGVAGGYLLALATGKIGQITNGKQKELRNLTSALNVAKRALSEIRAGASGDPTLSADVALYDIEQKETQ